jgi:nucleotide-binding universal stress UspA family protein
MNLEFKRILCPVDMSTFSLDALRLAANLAECSDATLDVLHVIHNPFDELYMTAIAETNPALIDAYAMEPQKRAKFVRATEEHSEVLLKQFCRDTVKQVPKVRYHIRNGDPFEAILEAAADCMTDLIVLATHGRTGVKRLVIGNVAEKVVRHAPCPVLTVKPQMVAGAQEAVG